MAPDVGLGDAGPLLRVVDQIPVTNAHLDCSAQSCKLQGTAGSTTPLNDAGARGRWDRSLGGCKWADLRGAALLLLGSPAPAAFFFPSMHSFCNVYKSF